MRCLHRAQVMNWLMDSIIRKKKMVFASKPSQMGLQGIA